MAELQERMSSREFSEWLAYNTIEPIGELRADLRLSMLATWIGRLLGAKRIDPWAFMPFTERPAAGAQVPAAGAQVAEAAEAAAQKDRALYAAIRSWALSSRGAKRGDSL